MDDIDVSGGGEVNNAPLRIGFIDSSHELPPTNSSRRHHHHLQDDNKTAHCIYYAYPYLEGRSSRSELKPPQRRQR
ncbi:hypothetical protein B0T18DRAFT_409927 [Schizothecium vesticola]|uniref:Uncharacterized protein n=1 Tax=Schizothecium vesticola TaxID=314040 RepID=A0AA40EUJ4_9PEZI|nr:hypothetical protein B0T18DRAFT_409927 [Schizothecium vesticola]